MIAMQHMCVFSVSKHPIRPFMVMISWKKAEKGPHNPFHDACACVGVCVYVCVRVYECCTRATLTSQLLTGSNEGVKDNVVVGQSREMLNDNFLVTQTKPIVKARTIHRVLCTWLAPVRGKIRAEALQAEVVDKTRSLQGFHCVRHVSNGSRRGDLPHDHAETVA